MHFNFSFFYFFFSGTSTKPKIWYCIVGTNDLRNIRERDMLNNPDHVLSSFLKFFELLRSFSPSSKIVWASIGHVRRYETSYDTFKFFENFINSKKRNFPDWLKFQDVTSDCSDKTIRDEFGHWENFYTKIVAYRLVRCVVEYSSQREYKNSNLMKHFYLYSEFKIYKFFTNFSNRSSSKRKFD